MSKMDTKTIIHVACETVVIAGVTFVLYKQISNLKERVTNLEKENEAFKQMIERHDAIFREMFERQRPPQEHLPPPPPPPSSLPVHTKKPVQRPQPPQKPQPPPPSPKEEERGRKAKRSNSQESRTSELQEDVNMEDELADELADLKEECDDEICELKPSTPKKNGGTRS